MPASHFHSAVPEWLEKVCLTLLLCAQVLVSAMPASSVSLITASLGDERDTVQFIYYGGIIGGVAAYPLVGRVTGYFRRRQILLYGTLLELVFLVLLALSRDDLQLFLFNYILSSVRMVCLITTIGMFLQKFNPTNSRGILYGLYYGISFSLSQFDAYWVARILQTFSWKYTFLVSLPGILLSLLIIAFLMHGRRLARRIPLYQVDWLGYILFVAPSLCLVFVCIFGERLDWLQDIEIRYAALASILGYAAWVVRMLVAKRPFVHLRVLGDYSHVRIGVVLMVALFFIYNTFSISNEFMAVNLGRDGAHIAADNLYLVISFALFVPATGYWLHRVHRVRESLFTGFALFAIYYIYTANLFYPEENSAFFIFPTIIRGAAYGISITSLSYYASVNIPAAENASRAFFSIASRSVVAGPVTGAVWLAVFNRFKVAQYTIISAQYAEDDYRVSELWSRQIFSLRVGNGMQQASEIAASSVHGMIYKDALILSAQNIYYLLAAVSVVLATIALSLRVLNIHYERERNKYPLTYIDV